MTAAATARIAFADGTVLRGRSVGAVGTVGGEAVFNTGMTGYQEVLTDPSYRGQIVTMTYPEIGNYGINPEDMESDRAQVAGFVMRQCCDAPSNFRSRESLADFLRRSQVIAIDDVDTRAITRKLRVSGAMNAVISSEDRSDAELVEQACTLPSMAGLDLASGVGTTKPYEWTEASTRASFGSEVPLIAFKRQPHIVAIDFGIKRNILRLLSASGFRVTVVPATHPAEAIAKLAPDGIFLSNGPGDPAAVTAGIATVKTLIAGDVPLFGICLGHQILSLAYGARTYKLKFGHRGANHPIKRLKDGAVEIASHNHGFAVDPKSLPAGVRVSHVNLNDQTCAGIEHESKKQFSVQYHPEAGPGPADPLYLFQQFAEHVKARVG
ncbi:MAG: glutamine-hydrolyzing carbamoyl-phosphate synthase small subunit [Planctomycetes bacterium]|nr:glutamine-hydrolyzing carbamoyl-phosphate synthase small subunit [Planctomycetota bacterium]